MKYFKYIILLISLVLTLTINAGNIIDPNYTYLSWAFSDGTYTQVGFNIYRNTNIVDNMTTNVSGFTGPVNSSWVYMGTTTNKYFYVNNTNGWNNYCINAYSLDMSAIGDGSYIVSMQASQIVNTAYKDYTNKILTPIKTNIIKTYTNRTYLPRY